MKKWVFLYMYFAISYKTFFSLSLIMMLSWCCVTKNIKTSLLFLLFVGAVPLLWILSPIDVTLYFSGLSVFDCISRTCWSKSMCAHVHRTVDILHRWNIELTLYEHHDHKQATKRNFTPKIRIYFKTSTWKSFVNPWRALSTNVKTGRTEAKTFLASF